MAVLPVLKQGSYSGNRPPWLTRQGNIIQDKPAEAFNLMYDNAFPSNVTTTRATSAWDYTDGGVLTQFSSGVPRFGVNPSTLLPIGSLIEELRTNSIRNPRCEGAVAGTPGTLPTNWIFGALGLTQTVVGSGTINGIPYVDLNIAGTTSGAGASQWYFDNTTIIAASQNQVWTNSMFLAVVGGTTNNISEIRSAMDMRGAAGVYISTLVGSDIKSSLSSSMTRITHTATLTNASTQYVMPIVQIVVTGAVAVNITIRIGAPQLELGQFATSVILPPVGTPGATTRNADNFRITDVTGLSTINFSATEGSIYTEFMVEGVGSTTNYPGVICFDDGTINNAIVLFVADPVDDTVRLDVLTGGVTQAALTSTVVVTPNTFYRVGFSWKANSFRLVVNGTAVAEDTSGTIPTVTHMRFGMSRGGNTPLNGWIQRVIYWNKQLSFSDLKLLTA